MVARPRRPGRSDHKEMFMSLLTRSFLAVALLLAAPLVAHADMPGKHPAFLHALTDLRHARGHLAARKGNPEMKWDEHTAIKEIDAAINEIKLAAIEDGKPLEDHPPIDAKMGWPGLMHRALELLQQARHDIEGEEDNNFARGLKKRAFEHIDAAILFTKQGIANAH
jgi:hypothetical protein